MGVSDEVEVSAGVVVLAKYSGTEVKFEGKVLGHRRIRVVYNRGTDETIVVTVMLCRRESSGT